MLRITSLNGNDARPTLKLEGSLSGPWVDEARTALSSALGGVDSANLDLAALMFADEAGVRLLQEWLQQGLRVTSCSSYLAELMRHPARHSPVEAET